MLIDIGLNNLGALTGAAKDTKRMSSDGWPNLVEQRWN
jgi:hypothetical protein